MLFYFQFLANARTPLVDETMVVHALVQAENVDTAAEQVTSSMGSVYLSIGGIRRAFVVREMDELSTDPQLLALWKQAERSRYAFLFEFSDGTEALCGPSLSQFIATRLPYAAVNSSFATLPEGVSA